MGTWSTCRSTVSALLSFSIPPQRASRIHLRFGSLGQPALFWRHVFKSLKGFDEGLQIAADYDFRLKAAPAFRFRKVNEVLSIFRFHSDSKSLGSLNSLEETVKVRASYYAHESLRIPAEQSLYGLLWARYHTAKLFILWTKRSANRKKEGPRKCFRETKATRDIPLWKLCLPSYRWSPIRSPDGTRVSRRLCRRQPATRCRPPL